MIRSGLWAFVVGATFTTTPALANCMPEQIELRGAFGSARFSIELADDPAERSRGLMFREELPRGSGMLFIYDKPQRATFWMRNTLIALDMLFIGDDGRITHIHENAIPLDETTIDGGADVRGVLEINGGLSGVFGIEIGDVVRHPSLDQSKAIWPCDEKP